MAEVDPARGGDAPDAAPAAAGAAIVAEWLQAARGALSDPRALCQVWSDATAGGTTQDGVAIRQQLLSLDVSEGAQLTALHVASRGGNLETAGWLLDVGSAVNAQDINGWTALVHACTHGHSALVTLLVKHGADVALATTRNSAGVPAGSIAATAAQLSGHAVIAKQLVAAGQSAAAVSPQDAAGFFSKLCFEWVTPVLAHGWKHGLQLADMLQLPQRYAVNDVADQLGAYLRSNGGNLGQALWSHIGRTYIMYTMLLCLQTAGKLATTQCLAALLAAFSNPSAEPALLYGTAVGIVGFSMFATLMHHAGFMASWCTGMNIRMGLTGIVFRKALSVQLAALSEGSGGNIISFITSDAERFQNLCIYSPFVMLAPVEATLVVFLMWREIGVAALAGLACVLAMVVVQSLMSNSWAKYRSDTARLSDQRIRTTSQVVTGMRVIKLYAWEPPFHAAVTAVRAEESKLIKRTATLRAATMAVAAASPVIVGLLTFVAYYGLGQPMTPRAIFTTLSLLQILQLTLGSMFPQGVQAVSESRIAARRLQTFLSQPDLPSRPATDAQQPFGVKLDGVFAAWDSHSPAPSQAPTPWVLSDVSFEMARGSVCAVVGTVGTGKSSLLLSILGELPAAQGTVSVAGKIAYVSQEPWLLSGSVRDNILFGRPFDQEAYDQVVHACALRADFEQLVDGDETLIGERGVNLSGGQKARISLARGCYMNADVYLLDDPLAAVDARVCRWLFEKCITGLLRGKTRVLATHQVQFLSAVDTVLVLRNGRVAGYGPFADLAQNSDLEQDIRRPRTSSAVGAGGAGREHASSSVGASQAVPAQESAGERPPEPTPLIVAETAAAGAIGMSIYGQYWRAAGGSVARAAVGLLLVAGSCLIVATNTYMSFWSGQPLQEQQSVGSVMIFVGLSLVTVLVGVIRAVGFVRMVINASSALHDAMFLHVLQAPISFFDANPVGRVLNRFSKDLAAMDELLPVVLLDVVNTFMLSLLSAGLVCVINPWIFLVLAPLLGLFILLRQFYMKSVRDIKRLESTSRSPVLATLSECMSGLATLRGYGVQGTMLQLFSARLTDNCRSYYTFIGAARWLGFRLDVLCTLLLAAVALVGVAARQVLDAGLIGLSLTYTLSLMGLFQWMVRQSAEMENQMVSVERVLEYTNIPVRIASQI